MKKIIITGHPQSGLEQIESLLLSAGMAAALPSQDKQLTAQEITAILCKAHGVAPLAQIQGDQTLAQIEVAPVWQGMVLDLMLANLQHPLWGWTDPHSIQLLEYWKAQDPQVVFVLVYDAPHTALTRLSLEDAAAPAEVLQQRLQTWVAYNSALLQFYLRNPQRCVLVHASEVEPSAQRYVQLINSRIDAPLQLSTPVQESQLLHPTDSAANEESAVTAAPAAPEHSIVLTQPVQNFTNSQQAHMLLAQLLETYPQAQTLYEELQAAATLPRNSQQALGWNGDAQSRFAAWQEFVQLHQRSRASHAELLKKQEQFTQAQQALEADFSKTTEQLSIELKKTQEALQTAQAKKTVASSQELEEENELLLAQLHMVQEELERYYLENQKLKAGGTYQRKMDAHSYYGAADRIKRQLSYRLGAVMIEKSRSLGGMVAMPFALRAEAKRFRQEQATRKGEKLPAIAHYRDAHEAERVKQHLSYRLGSTLVQHSNSLGGWLSMPWALRAQIKEFQKSRR